MAGVTQVSFCQGALLFHQTTEVIRLKCAFYYTSLKFIGFQLIFCMIAAATRARSTEKVREINWFKEIFID